MENVVNISNKMVLSVTIKNDKDLSAVQKAN